MKSRLLLVFCFVAIVLSIFVSCAEPVSQENFKTPTIKGTISIPSSQNVAFSDIFVKVIDPDNNTVTIQKAKPDGTFVIQNLKENTKYSVLFTSVEPEFGNRALGSSGGVGGWLHDVVPAILEGNDVGNVKLKPLGTIKGRALIDGKSEHYDITVYIPGTSYIAKTDKDGSFSIYNVPEGTYKLRYTLDDHLPIMLENIMLVCPEDAKNPEIKVKDVTLKSYYGVVHGTVLLDGVVDQTGISIKLESEDKNINKQLSSSSDGSFVFNDVEPGKYRIVVSHSGYITKSSDYFYVVSSNTTDISETIILFKSVGSIKGNALLKDASSHENISVLLKNSSKQYSTVTDQKGAYKIDGVVPGIYSLIISKEGYETVSEDGIIIEATIEKTLGTKTINPINLTVIGNVKLLCESNHSGVQIVATCLGDNTKIYSASSNNQGDFSLAGLPEGEYKIEYSKTSYYNKTIESVQITYDEEYRFNLDAVELQIITGRIEGKVTDDNKVGLGGITVKIVDQNTGSTFTTTSKEDGTYSFDLSQGNYMLSFNGLCRKSYTLDDTIVLLSGKTFVASDVELKSDHIWDEGKIITSSTCTEVGDKLFTCTRCGNERHDVIFKISHNTTYHPAVEATCIKPGNTSYWECTRCKKHLSSIFSDTEINEVIPAKGHNLSFVDYVAPTCEGYGNEAHYKCSVCSGCFVNDKMVEYETLQISPIGHKKKDIKIRENKQTYDLEFIYHCDTCGNEEAEMFISHKDQADLTELIIPEGVIEIEDDTFNGFSRIEKIVLPSTLQIIGNRCFNSVPGPIELTLDDALIRIGEYSFVGTYFDVLVLPSSDLCFNSSALMDAGINKLVIPANYSGDIPTDCWWISKVEIAPEGANYYVQGKLLMTGQSVMMILSNSVDEIVITETMNVGGNVFVHKGAGKLVLHDGFKLWEGMFFQSSFGEIVFPSDIKSIPKHAFEMAFGPSVFEIPEGVEKIEECAFFYGMMEEIVLPITIKEIENSALSDMPYLKKITILATTPPKISYNYFCLPDFKIFVPKESLDLYLNDSNWSEYSKYLYPIEGE